MIRILAFIMCMLPFTAFGASYQFAGDATCTKYGVAESCYLEATLILDDALFGQSYAAPEPTAVNVYNSDGLIGSLYAYFKPDSGTLPSIRCIEQCSFVETDAIGNLLSWRFWNYWQPVDGSWTPDGSRVYSFTGLGYSEISGELSLIPLPSAFYMFGAVLLGLGLLRRFKRS